MDFIHIALRNIRRNGRRSKLTILTIVIGVTILMNFQGLLRGITATVYGRMMAMDTAQVQVEAEGYRADARRLPLDRVIEDPAALAEEFSRVPGVRAVSQRVDASFEITNGVEGTRAMARGVDQEEVRVTELGEKLVEGRLFGPGEGGLVIGKGLADKLGLKLGDEAFFTAMDRRSVRNLGAAPVVGIFKYDYPLFDDLVVFLDIAQARSFLDLGDAATRLVIRGDAPTESAELTRGIAAALDRRREASATAAAGEDSAPPQALAAYEWKVFAENLVSTIDTRLRLLFSILGVLFCLIIAGIFNTMAMNVQERHREIGTLRALGLRRSGLRRIFLTEGLLLGLAGCAAAAV
ncbi:MAG: ABC transporter permease, partial [Spirochaetaceae bacterium]|nr:ABC transporter permease [Spirochaetaceae bacterium]